MSIPTTEFVPGELYVDGLTGNAFEVRQLTDVGGGRGLFFAHAKDRQRHQMLKKGTKVCMYARHLIVAQPSHDRHFGGENGRSSCSYAVQVTRSLVVEPASLDPDLEGAICYNLGLLVNAAMKEDPQRTQANTRLTVSNTSKLGPRVSLTATKTIYPGEEIITSYGADMLRWMRGGA